MLCRGTHLLGRFQDRITNPWVGPAPAYVAKPVKVRLGDRPATGVDLVDQSYGVHDLARLAVPALGDVVLEPRLLHRMELLAHAPREAFDGDNLVAVRQLADRNSTHLTRAAVDQTRAGFTHHQPAAVLRPVDVQQVSQDPQQPYVRGALDMDLLAVEDERVRRCATSPVLGMRVRGHRSPGAQPAPLTVGPLRVNPSVGDCGIGGTVGRTLKSTSKWLIGK